MNRTAEAVWTGPLTTGHGVISTQSGILKNTNYSFKTRFEGDPGTNPEELIAAAHSGCFSMALSMVLGLAGMTAEKIDTKAVVTLEKVGDGFEITKSALDLTIKVPGGDPAAIEAAAHGAKAGCPVSKLLKCEITLAIHIE
jgi:lipoyl-dependent peroxiredoxin